MLIKLFQMFFILFISLSCLTEAPLGTRKNPVKLYFTPSVDADTISTNSEAFIRFLEKETGYFFKTGIPTNYIAVVEAFGSLRADIAVMNSFGYIMTHEKFGAQAKLKVIRYGHDYYQGQIIAHVDSGIKKIEDINGKRFAFTDSSSTSGYMFPLKMMKDKNVKPMNSVFAMKHDNVVTMVYQKQVDAGATFYSAPYKGKIKDARSRVLTQFPDVEEKVKIVAVTEKIPNDPFVFRKGMPDEMVSKIIFSIKKYLESEEGRKIFNNIYSVQGVVDATDEDWNGLRKMVKTIGIEMEDLAK